MTSEKSPSFLRRLSKRLSGTPLNKDVDPVQAYSRSPIPNGPPPAYTEVASPNPGRFVRSPTGSSHSQNTFSRTPTMSTHGSNHFPTTQVHPPSPDLLHPHRTPSNLGIQQYYPVNTAPRPLASDTLSINTRSSQITRESLSTDDDPYAFLSTFDTAFLIDDSGSMRATDRGSATRRWDQAFNCISQIAHIAASHDDDGVDVYFINHKSKIPVNDEGKGPDGYLHLQEAGDVKEAFGMTHPSGGTLTGKRLRTILHPYLTYLEHNADDLDSIKPLNLIVITDGKAQDDVESVIVDAARRLDKLHAAPYQLGVQFFQVGNDEGARIALKELDDDLEQQKGIRDIVDTVAAQPNPDGSLPELTSDLILKTVLGSVVKKLDRKVYN